MKTGTADTAHIQVKDKAVRRAEYPELLSYFYSGCKHVKPVYDYRTQNITFMDWFFCRVRCVCLLNTLYYFACRLNTLNSWLWHYWYEILSCGESITFDTFQWLTLQNQPCGQHLYYGFTIKTAKGKTHTISIAERDDLDEQLFSRPIGHNTFKGSSNK
ncbi:uncharacterized protein LOC132936511 isoform X1 [Metopolophium dirhodum]|uniref:uncharacterized protein LOC132936511 isoform X1 n=1 Tax=Metopolophium dirhodum TaxID=44670 RepID=UPI00298FC3C2|nr:uncharacterized protein LOC132936511 isoform X1 [Metopolophium dirhodum]